MKICPRCQKTYSDENLNFCLDDGAVLMQSNAADNSIPATVMINQPRPTNPPSQFGNQVGAQANWNTPNQFSMQPPPKKSKTWLWALGVLGGLMLICGGGFVGLIFFAAKYDDGNSNNNRIFIANSSNYNATNGSKNKNTSTGSTSVQKLDISKWVKGDTDLGTTEYSGDELLMGSKKKGYYYVLAAQAIYKTENATTRVTVRNVNEDKTSLGFGLIIHSNPIPLTQDYAFLIDSENKKYRVVRHIPGDEIVVVGWTRSAAIKDGTQENLLEVRDQDKTMNFYINGEFIRTVGNTDGYGGGVTGLYSGDAVQIAFSDLEITK
ncbi:MAG: hypothetical protein LH472_11850 [Pyrinomonadaceae bacterium]|nr:hypothetical protein [Pyrinomonadaceae bacterium]